MFENSIRRMPRPQEVAQMDTRELRDNFMLTDLFTPGHLRGAFTDLDRLALGGIFPTNKAVELPNHRETGRSFFLEQRELGAINIGGPGVVNADGKALPANSLSCVYAGSAPASSFLKARTRRIRRNSTF